MTRGCPARLRLAARRPAAQIELDVSLARSGEEPMVHDHDHDHDHGDDHAHGHRHAGARAAIALPQSRLAWAAVPEVAQDMGRAAGAWLAALDSPRRRVAQLGWSDRREDWHYVPRSRPGLPMGRM